MSAGAVNAQEAALDRLDWARIAAQLDAEGYAVLPGLLGVDVARNLARHFADSMAPPEEAFCTTRTALDACGLGRGELLYFSDGLPAPLAQLRTALYRRLVRIANRWNETLGIDRRPPAQLADFVQLNRQAGQTRAQSHLSRLRVDDHLLLHQRNVGAQVFPLQIVAVLGEPGVDFQGGEFVMTEQRPRMQSRPAVVPLRLGDLAVIATAQRPFRGASGHYRVNLKHAISRVRQGERIGLELSFHDAL